MKVLFCGDIVGRAGRDAVTKKVPRLRRELGLDFVVVNGENAAAGFGITAKICAELHAAGVDCITTGNHVWDQREIIALHRPGQAPAAADQLPARHAGLGRQPVPDGARPEDRGHQRHVPAVHGRARRSVPRASMSSSRSTALGGTAHFILVDVHGEATSEKQSMGHYCDGRVSAVLGTPQPRPDRRLAGSCPAAPPTRPMSACAATTIW